MREKSKDLLLQVVSSKMENLGMMVNAQNPLEPEPYTLYFNENRASDKLDFLLEKMSEDFLIIYLSCSIEAFSFVYDDHLPTLKTDPAERFLNYCIVIAEEILKFKKVLKIKNKKISSLMDLVEALYGDSTSWPWWPDLNKNESIAAMVALMAFRDGLDNMSMSSLEKFYDMT